jgi:hypothetical protein
MSHANVRNSPHHADQPGHDRRVVFAEGDVTGTGRWRAATGLDHELQRVIRTLWSD